MKRGDAQGDDRKRLREWLALFNGPGYQGQEVLDRAIAEMRAVGADRLCPLLIPMLSDPDLEVRCKACKAILCVDARRGLELVLPLLDDPDEVVRWCVCGCLHDVGDERAVAPLIRVLQTDPDAQVRGTAAHALGGIGSPATIPALLAAMETDHEFDMHGHSPSSISAQALDDILGTNETRIRSSKGLRKMRERPPDLERLKQLARETYEDWLRRQGE